MLTRSWHDGSSILRAVTRRLEAFKTDRCQSQVRPALCQTFDRPLCCLRNLVRFWCSTLLIPLRTTAGHREVWPLAFLVPYGHARRRHVHEFSALKIQVLNPDDAYSSHRFGQCVNRFCTQSVERHAPSRLPIRYAARFPCTTQTDQQRHADYPRGHPYAWRLYRTLPWTRREKTRRSSCWRWNFTNKACVQLWLELSTMLRCRFRFSDLGDFWRRPRLSSAPFLCHDSPPGSRCVDRNAALLVWRFDITRAIPACATFSF